MERYECITTNGLKTLWECSKCHRSELLYDEITEINNSYGGTWTKTVYETQAFWWQHLKTGCE